MKHSKYLKHDQQPLRRIVAAGAVLLGGLALESCADDTTTQPLAAATRTVTVSPIPTPTSSPTELPSSLATNTLPSSTQRQADRKLTHASKEVASHILGDLKNLGYNTSVYRVDPNEIRIDNSNYIEHEKTKRAGEVAVSTDYNRDTHVVEVTESQGINPLAPPDRQKQNLVQVDYDVLGLFADKKMSAGKKLTIKDFEKLVSSFDSDPTTIIVEDDAADKVEYYENDGYLGNHYGETSAQDGARPEYLGPPTADKVTELMHSMSSVQQTLRDHLTLPDYI